MTRRLIAFTHARGDPAARFRLLQFVPGLERAGWSVSHRPNRPERPWESPFEAPPLRWAHQRAGVLLRRFRRRLDVRSASGFDVAFVNRDLLEGSIAWEETLWRRNPRVVLDFDDTIHLGRKAAHFARAAAGAAWITAGNENLLAVARKWTDRVSLLPTVIDTARYPAPPGVRADVPLRVGWLGSDLSIRETLFPFLPMLGELQAELGFEFVVVSRPRRELPGTRLHWRFVEWSPDVEARIAEFFDVGIMPLVDDEFQRGKCGCKLLQYMAAGIPAIASPVGVNASILADGRGFAAGDPQGWGEALLRLRDPGLRAELGLRGRAYVERAYSVRAWLPHLLDVLDGVRTGRRPAAVAPER